MAGYKGLKLQRHPDSFVFPSTKYLDDGELNPDPVVLTFYTGILDFSQDQEVRQAAERIDEADEDRTYWSRTAAEYALPLVIIEHDTSDWNLDIASVDPVSGYEDFKPLDRNRRDVINNVLPSDLKALGRHLWKEVKDSLGVVDANILETMTNPLGLVTPSSPENDEMPLTSITTESLSPSQETASLNDASPPGSSEESRSPDLIRA